MRLTSMISATRKRFAAALCMLGAVFAAPAAAQAQEALQLNPLPIESIARLPAIQGVTLSPDGKHLAALVASPDHRWPVISVWNLETGAPPVWIPSATMRPRAVSFLGNDRLLFLADQPFTYGNYQGFTVQAIVTDLDGRNFTDPFRVRGALASEAARDSERFGFNFSVLQDGSVQDPNRYLLTRTNLNNFTTEVLSLDARTMRTERVARAGDDESFILADEVTGELMVKQTANFENNAWYVHLEIRNRATDAWERHPDLSYPIRERFTINPLGFLEEDRNKLYFSINRGSNFAQIRVYDILTRTWEPEAAFASPEFDIVDVIGGRDPETRQLTGPIGFVMDGPGRTQTFQDAQWAPIMAALRRQFPGRDVTFVERRSRLNLALIAVEGPRYPTQYYLIRNGRELTSLGNSMPWVNPEQMGNTTFVRYTTRDGVQLPAFVTLPPGYDRARHGRIPVVVHPHGGPWSRDFLGWDSSGWTQFMATRGYAVIQPQYRGSDGWGMDIWKAGDQQWGLRMSDDDDDAGMYLVNEGIGDRNRMAIFGYSYGGWAAIAATVRPQSPYRCALAGAGVASLTRIQNEWGDSRIQRELQGWTVDGMNPMANVENAHIPLMMYHGSHDRQADTVHSREFYAAMRAAGKPVVYHEIETMWHQLPWWPEWHRETLGYIQDWFAGPNCFGGQAATAPAANSSGY